MKKIALIIALLAFSVSSMAQSKNNWHEGRFERSKLYAELAAEEFGLTKEQQQEVYEKKVVQYEESYEAKKKYKKGEITKEEMKIPNKKFGKYFSKLTGKNYQELKPFYEKVQKEMAKIK